MDARRCGHCRFYARHSQHRTPQPTRPHTDDSEPSRASIRNIKRATSAARSIAMRSILAIVAGLLLCANVSAQSGWYVRQGGSFDQCTILIDSVPGGTGCVHRLSALCVQNGVGYSRGYASYTGPVTLPRTLELYQPPNVNPVGSLTITSLGLSASMSLNGSAGAWTQAAVFSGLSCATSIRKPNDRP